MYRKGIIDDTELEEQLKDIKHQENKLSDLKAITEDKINNLKNQDTLINNMAAKMKMYNDKLDKHTFEDKTDIVHMLVKEITVEPIVEGGQRVPDIRVIYNLIKLEHHTDKDTHNKFDINKKFLPIIYKTCTPGVKLRELRLNHGVTIKDLSNAIKTNETTLMHIEQDKINIPYWYWKNICDYFHVNHINYLGLYTLPQDSIQEKLIKIRAGLGARTWEDVGMYLGYSKGYISDMLTRYVPTGNTIKNIDSKLQDLFKKGDI